MPGNICELFRVNSLISDVIFTAQYYASAVLAMALCLSDCLSVCHKSVFYKNG